MCYLLNSIVYVIIIVVGFCKLSMGWISDLTMYVAGFVLFTRWVKNGLFFGVLLM